MPDYLRLDDITDYLSAEKDVDVPGFGTVRIRALSFDAFHRVIADDADDSDIVVEGLVKPAVEASHRDAIRRLPPSVVSAIAREIMLFSMTDQQEGLQAGEQRDDAEP